MNDASNSAAPSAGDIVGKRGASGPRRALIAGSLVALVAIAAWWLLVGGQATPAISYLTAPVTNGRLVVKVSATGNLHPTNQVDVGSELSGVVDSVLVDDNDRVRKGQLLAQLDLARLRDQVARSEAALAVAQAQVVQAQASTAEAQANLARLREVSRLSGGKVPSKAEMATAEAASKRSVAAEASARAAVRQADAQLRSDSTNVEKASIRSPIDGVVLLRKVEPGQTVVAAMQAPVLFTLAESLSQMQLQVSVDEADVGQVEIGQPAVFSVDAYPGRNYPAKIARVGFGSQTTNGVVSYLTILNVDNDDLSLRPGMTATADITVRDEADVLLAPNAALRWSPPAAASVAPSRSFLSSLLPGPPRGGGARKPAAPAPGGGHQRLWSIGEDGTPRAIDVLAGPTDGRVTRITETELKAGQSVIIDSVAASK